MPFAENICLMIAGAFSPFAAAVVVVATNSGGDPLPEPVRGLALLYVLLWLIGCIALTIAVWWYFYLDDCAE